MLTVTPGVATALVIRSAVRGGRREALAVTVGNSLGVLAWAIFAAVGVAAVVAASAELFTTIKLIGAVVLVILGVQGLLARKAERAAAPAGHGIAGRPAHEPRQPEARGLLRRPVPAVHPGGRSGAAERARDGGDDRRARPGLVLRAGVGRRADAPRVRGPLAAAGGAADGRGAAWGSAAAGVSSAATQSSTSPATQVTVPPPTQIVPPASTETCTRPARPSAVPWRAT